MGSIDCEEASRIAHIPACASGVPIFRALPAESLDQLGDELHHRHYAKGEMVIAAGAPVDYLIVVARGRLKMAYTNSRGREQAVRILEPGQFLGEMALFVPTTLDGDLVALEESDACQIPRQAVQSLLREHPEVALRLVEALAQRLAEAEQLIIDLGVRDVGQRAAAELVRHAAGGTTGPEGIKIKLPVTWAEMAVRLGTTPESLSRRVKTMAEEGLIEQKGARTVIIRDLERLRNLAEG